MTKKNFYVIIYIQKIRKKVRKMARYFIWAAEQLYEGLHGIETYRVKECSSYEDACNYALELSFDVIDSYCEEEYRRMAEERIDICDYDNEGDYWDDFDEILCDLESESTCWKVTEVNEEKASDISTDELDLMFCQDPDETIKKYGKSEEE